MCLLVIMFMIANTSAQTRVIAHRGFWKTQGSAQNSITSLLKADSIGSVSYTHLTLPTNREV